MADSPSQGEFTRLLRDADNRAAAQALFPIVYDELRALARHKLEQERPGHTLQTTALVHEAYLRLVGAESIPGHSRTRFFAAAAEAMRRILLDHARKRGRLKRGGGQQRISLECVDLAVETDCDQILIVDEAIQRLQEWDPRFAEIVKLRFFAGLSAAETASALGVTAATIRREWKLARAWLARELSAQ